MPVKRDGVRRLPTSKADAPLRLADPEARERLPNGDEITMGEDGCIRRLIDQVRKSISPPADGGEDISSHECADRLAEEVRARPHGRANGVAPVDDAVETGEPATFDDDTAVVVDDAALTRRHHGRGMGVDGRQLTGYGIRIEHVVGAHELDPLAARFLADPVPIRPGAPAPRCGRENADAGIGTKRLDDFSRRIR